MVVTITNNFTNNDSVRSTVGAELYQSAELLVYRDEPKPKLAQKRRNVSYFPVVLIKTHLHFQDLTEDEHDAIWYKKRDYANMKQECIPIVKLVMRGKYDGDDNERCFRGLEYRTIEGSNKRRLNKCKAIQAVLVAQDNYGNDYDTIRTEYSKIAVVPQEEAHILALEDAKEAMEIYVTDIMKMNNPLAA
jgi:hypothetical protein